MKAGYGFGAEPTTVVTKSGTFKPTSEQAAIVSAFKRGGDLVINAGAGTGKTSTLKMVSGAVPKKSLVYIAYNRAVADESGRSFPENTHCATAHSIAFRAVGRAYAHRLNSSRMPSRMVAARLGTAATRWSRHARERWGPTVPR